MLIQHISLNFQLIQIDRFFYILKKDISFESNFDVKIMNFNIIDSFEKKKF